MHQETCQANRSNRICLITIFQTTIEASATSVLGMALSLSVRPSLRSLRSLPLSPEHCAIAVL